MHLTDLQHVKIHSVKTLGLQWVQSKHAGSQNFFGNFSASQYSYKVYSYKKKRKSVRSSECVMLSTSVYMQRVALGPSSRIILSNS